MSNQKLIAAGVVVAVVCGAFLLFAAGSLLVGPLGTTSGTDWRDFVDHPGKYKGKTVTLPLTLSQNYGLHEEPIAFFETDGGNEIVVSLPKDIYVPNVTRGTKLWVTFLCDGTRGNVAKKIERR